MPWRRAILPPFHLEADRVHARQKFRDVSAVGEDLGASNPGATFHGNGRASETLLLVTGGYTAVPQLLQLRWSVI